MKNKKSIAMAAAATAASTGAVLMAAKKVRGKHIYSCQIRYLPIME